MNVLTTYLILANITSGTLFTYDKIAKKKQRTRIQEYVLHISELLGGSFVNLILIYISRHKSDWENYYFLTWLYLCLWIFGIVFYLSGALL